MNPLSLSGRTAVVIGASSGIGRALAIGLAQAGADVVATARRQEQVEAVTHQISVLGRRTFSQTSDVTDSGSLENLLKRTVGELEKIDILVNAAGITGRVPTLDLKIDDWNRILDVNLTGTLRACQIFGRHMLGRGYGRIINIASLSTYVAFHEVAAYGVSKAGVGALTKSLAVEWGKQGVNVNGIAPGVFPTELNQELLNGTARGQELIAR